ncbi:DUF6817 domain-containing protein [Brevundimonas aurantiaca]|jgi:SM-20-related protein|uniref:DUF6817 domain-containing protein n=1 Tax=Brevundimonas aurantiaca TaxID=74316 RepID=UPI00174B6D56|nr:2OG-Fe(II) oxygenase [Brevundimonas aurantiaca]
MTETLAVTHAEATTGLDRDQILTFLKEKGVDDVRHSGKTLLDHLLGVEEIVARWGADETVRLGALFHSIYGTENFRRAVLRPTDRTTVRAVIGENAERLAWRFGSLRAESLFRAAQPGADPVLAFRGAVAPITVTVGDLRAIATVYAANWLEQFDRMRARSRAGRMVEMRELADWLGGKAKQDIDAAYGFNVKPLVLPDRTRKNTRDDAVEVWDGAVPKELQIRLAGLMDLNIWRYGWKASEEQTAYGFWHSHFGGDDNDASVKDCEHDLVGRPLVAPVLELWRMLQAGPLKGHVPVRVYANAHTFGGDGHLHRDHTAPGHFTTIYYAHPEWKPNWAGETVFFEEKTEEITASVFPKPGRLAHFPGRLLHAARSPSRECPALRSVIVFKSRVEV